MTHGGKSTADITPFTKRVSCAFWVLSFGCAEFGAVSRFDIGLHVPTISQRVSTFKACSEKGILGSQVPKELATGSMPPNTTCLIQRVTEDFNLNPNLMNSVVCFGGGGHSPVVTRSKRSHAWDSAF